jgi:gas vesicle protein
MKHVQHRLLYFLFGLVVGTVFGGLLGGLTALWVAPQSGSQTQKLVRQQGKALKQQAEKTASQVYEQIEDTAAGAVDQVERLRHEGEQFLDDRVERINQATASVKKAVSA